MKEAELDLQWKEVPNFNGRYAMSSIGEIFDNKMSRKIKPHMSGVKRRNYPQVTLYKDDGTKHTKRVHSLMAMAFLGFEYKGSREYVVDHIDNNPTNNNINNLRVVTMKENNYKNK